MQTDFYDFHFRWLKLQPTSSFEILEYTIEGSAGGSLKKAVEFMSRWLKMAQNLNELKESNFSEFKQKMETIFKLQSQAQTIFKFPGKGLNPIFNILSTEQIQNAIADPCSRERINIDSLTGIVIKFMVGDDTYVLKFPSRDALNECPQLVGYLKKETEIYQRLSFM